MVNMPHDDHCHAVDKRRFPTKGAASQCIRTLKERSRRQYVPKRSYFCKYCHGWHVTSGKNEPFE